MNNKYTEKEFISVDLEESLSIKELDERLELITISADAEDSPKCRTRPIPQ